MCHSTPLGASSAIVNGMYRDGRSRAKQIAHCFPDESWCQWMSVKNAAISSVTVKTVDIHRPKRRGCKTLITANDNLPRRDVQTRMLQPECYGLSCDVPPTPCSSVSSRCRPLERMESS